MTATHAGPAEAGPSSAGQVGRRRPLPTGRAVAGGFFVAVAVVAVFAAWLTGTAASGRAWVVAAHDLPAGTRLRARDLGTETMTLPAQTTGHLAFGNPASLVGRVLDAPMRAGELLQAGDLSSQAGTPSLRPVTVDVAPADASDVTDGMAVDVLVTDGSSPSSPTSVVVAGARLLDVGRASGSLVAGTTGTQVTLGVSTLGQVTSIVHAAQTGTLSLIEGRAGDRAAPGAGFGSGTSLFGGSATGTPGG